MPKQCSVPTAPATPKSVVGVTGTTNAGIVLVMSRRTVRSDAALRGHVTSMGAIEPSTRGDCAPRTTDGSCPAVTRDRTNLSGLLLATGSSITATTRSRCRPSFARRSASDKHDRFDKVK